MAILDCGWESVRDALTGARIPASRVIAYRVTDVELPAAVARTVRIPADCARAIGYSRLIQDAMQTRPSLVISPEVRRQLLTLPARGRFRAATPISRSADNLDDFCRSPANQRRIQVIVRDEAGPHGLETFLDANDLARFGRAFTPGIYSHHFFVSEIAHEITS